MLCVALFEPEIPPNTGNIARLCAANRVPLHIVGRAAFSMDDRAVRRAGLDYWSHVEIHQHADLVALAEVLPRHRVIYFTTKASRHYTDFEYGNNDCLVFGPETRGLPATVLDANRDACLTIPMLSPHVRSLNLANAVSIVLYEALRQVGAFGEKK